MPTASPACSGWRGPRPIYLLVRAAARTRGRLVHAMSAQPRPRGLLPGVVTLILIAPELSRIVDFTRLPRLQVVDDQRRARQPAPPALAAGGAGHLAGERLPPLGRRRERAGGRLLPRRPDRRGGAGRRPAALAPPPRAGGPGRAGDRDRRLPRRAAVRHRLHERQGPGDRRPDHLPDLLRGPAGARCPVSAWGRSARARSRAGARRRHGPLQLPCPAPGAGRAHRPRRPARRAAPPRPGPQGAVPRPRQLRRLRAARGAGVHRRAQLLRPQLREAGPAPEDVFRKFDFDSVTARDPGPLPVRDHDPRRLRERPAAELSAGAARPPTSCSGSEPARSGRATPWTKAPIPARSSDCPLER